MLKELQKTMQMKMQRSIDNLKYELSKLRTGRAHPSILENLIIECYGNTMPLNQVACITASNARLLIITPYDKTILKSIDKTIRNSKLNLNPSIVGNVIHVPLPSLTKERRLILTKQLKSNAEDSRISIRNIRRNANNHIKILFKNKNISEDEERKEQDNIQNITDIHIDK